MGHAVEVIDSASEHWMDRGEVERRLGVGTVTVTRLVLAGLVGSTTLPGAVRRRYRRSDVESLVRRGIVGDVRANRLVEAERGSR